MGTRIAFNGPMRVVFLVGLVIAACGSSTTGTPPSDGAIDAPGSVDAPTVDGRQAPDGAIPDGPVIDAPVIDASTIDANLGPDAAHAVCGGFVGAPCTDSTTYCEWADLSCGGGDQQGMCLAKPQTCPTDYAPVCGCDRKVYGNSCAAAMAGVDLNAGEGCTAPQGYFDCGTIFCHVGSEYCQKTYGGAFDSPPTFTCKPIPAACNSSPTCDCFAGEECVMQCTMDQGNYTLTCLFP
jgi:hypothetical protein